MMRFNQQLFGCAIISLLLFLPIGAHTSWAQSFVVVIDAGHGGKDPGALGKITQEKHINLNVALKLGQLIQQNCPDVKVVYTRQTDVFIPLDQRAKIANDAKADLFISIHTNALPRSKTYVGASTYTLGLSKSDANLAVAQRENSVIMYENDYQTRYAGFNPNSAESYIIFEFMQDKYMSQSVNLASLLQQYFKNTCQRVDRGVHQAGFLVLKSVAMPSVLIELGFISSPVEEKYLHSEAGVDNLAKGIFSAFLVYKDEQLSTRRQAQPSVSTTPKPEVQPAQAAQVVESVIVDRQPRTARPTPQATNEIIFKVQILASTTILSKNDKRLKGLEDTQYYVDGNLYKYTYGHTPQYDTIRAVLKSLADRFPDAFIVAFRNGERINTQEAIRSLQKKRQ